jgi:adenine deaminase
MSSRVADYIEASLGDRPLSVLIKDAELLNVYTGELYRCSIGIYRDRIVLVSPDDIRNRADRVLDARGYTAIPGLVDSHLHVESSMVTPWRFAEAVIPHGTTTAFADPHEIANVLGKEGVRMMLENAHDLPMRLLFFAPTCVPESNAVTAGAEVTPDDIEDMLGWEGICGLGEVMDFPAVLARRKKIMQILEIGRRHNAVVDGHSPLLTGAELSAYMSSGAEADHENFTVESVVEKLRLGMYVKLRGPYLLDVEKYVNALKSLPKPWNLILCTDDVMPDNLIEHGHLDYVARSFIRAGMDPVEVVRSVTLRPALHMRTPELGAIAPGKVADLVLLKDLTKFQVHLVIAGGRVVAEDGFMRVELPRRPFDPRARGTVHLRPLTLRDLKVGAPVKKGSVRVRVIDFAKYKGGVKESNFLEVALTKLGVADLDVKNGEFVLGEVSLVFVFERHGLSGRKAYGFAKNLIRFGGLASTVAHDTHNLIVTGTDRADMRDAANLVVKSGGGIAAVLHGRTLARVELPIAGLMSEESLKNMAKRMRGLRHAFRVMGVLDHPYMPLPCLMTLSVIPHARITDRGIFDVDNQRFVHPIVSA